MFGNSDNRIENAAESDFFGPVDFVGSHSAPYQARNSPACGRHPVDESFPLKRKELDLIDFYDARFQINLTRQQKNDLANFLEAF